MVVQHKPMKGDAVDLKIQKYPAYASSKLDGIRAWIKDGQVLSSRLEVIPNQHLQKLFGRKQLNGLDGELIVGDPLDDQVRNSTSGRLNSPDGEPDVRFYVFDRWDSLAPYLTRYESLEEQLGVPTTKGDPILVPHRLVNNEIELLEYEKQKLDEGYEGLVLRAPDGPYKYGRSTTKQGWMLKMKRFMDAEARVLRVNEEMKNNNKAEKNKLGRTKRSSSKAGKVGKGRAGELEVVGVNGRFKGVEFVVPLGGAGDAGKDWWWTVGKKQVEAGEDLYVTYRFFPKGVKNKPLLTTYGGVRPTWDFDTEERPAEE